MDNRAEQKGETMDPQDAEVAIHELSTASMKYALISSSTSNLVRTIDTVVSSIGIDSPILSGNDLTVM
jgi:hypothetical protein